MGLLSWIMIAVVVLSMIGQDEMYLFPASRGHRQTTNGMSPIVKDLDKQIKQYPAINNITASNNTPAGIEKKINV